MSLFCTACFKAGSDWQPSKRLLPIESLGWLSCIPGPSPPPTFSCVAVFAKAKNEADHLCIFAKKLHLETAVAHEGLGISTLNVAGCICVVWQLHTGADSLLCSSLPWQSISDHADSITWAARSCWQVFCLVVRLQSLVRDSAGCINAGMMDLAPSMLRSCIMLACILVVPWEC